MAPERAARMDRKIFIGRSARRARGWIELLGARGAVVTAHELVQLESMVGEARPQRAIDTIDEFNWILLTSVNGVRFLLRALQARGIDPASLVARFGVVGPATAEALEQAGIVAAVVAAQAHAHAEGLAESLAAQVRSEERVLIVRPEVTRPVLQERLEDLGAEVDSVPFYRNRPAGGLPQIAAGFSAEAYDVAVFAAPSAFTHLFEQLGSAASVAGRWPELVAIGEVTAAAIEAHGCRVAAIASEPTAEGIADAVERALSG